MQRRHFLAGTAVATALLAGCAGTDAGTTTAPGSDTTTDPGDDTTTEPDDDTTTEPGDTTTDQPVGAGVANGDFEDGLSHWTVGTDLPDDPNNPGQKVAAEATTTTAQAANGQHALELYIDGSQDDGTIWVQQAADLSTVDSLSVEVYSEQESFNTITKLAVYTGPAPEDGLSEGDFDTSRATETHEGWDGFEYEVDHDGQGIVAVGISVVWETEVVRYLDAVTLGQSD